MIIEKYDANPAANAFVYITVNLLRDYRCVQLSAIAATADLEDVTFAIYRGTISAWDVGNHYNALYMRKWFCEWVAGQISQGWWTPSDTMDVELFAGTYTFAAYIVSDVTNFKMIWFLK